MNSRQRQRKRQIALFTNLLNFVGFFARQPALTPITNFLLRTFARFTIKLRDGRHQSTLGEIGKEWQRMFPSRAFVPIRESAKDTVYAEILGKCPVTGTGDVHACYRLMEYDRQLLNHIGGEFVVLASKADPSVPVCRVAMRMKGANMSDLKPAHEK
jgi:hypothetical protein